MTDGGQPFQPPRPPGQPPPGSGPPPTSGDGGTGWVSLLAVLFGLLLGTVVPPLVFGIVIAITGNGPAAPAIVVSLAAAVGLTAGAFLLIIRNMDTAVPKQAAVRTAMTITGWISLAMWAGGLLLVGVCIAVFAGAY